MTGIINVRDIESKRPDDKGRYPERDIHLPTTSIAAETIAVWKEGASADTSQLYTPAASRSNFVSTTCVALLSVFCGITVIRYDRASRRKTSLF